MKRLLLFFILISSACIIKAQQENQNFSLTGIWVFEKAEYMELTQIGRASCRERV